MIDKQLVQNDITDYKLQNDIGWHSVLFLFSKKSTKQEKKRGEGGIGYDLELLIIEFSNTLRTHYSNRYIDAWGFFSVYLTLKWNFQ